MAGVRGGVHKVGEKQAEKKQLEEARGKFNGSAASFFSFFFIFFCTLFDKDGAN